MCSKEQRSLKQTKMSNGNNSPEFKKSAQLKSVGVRIKMFPLVIDTVLSSVKVYEPETSNQINLDKKTNQFR